jgi:hypothetical protein
MHDNLRTAAQLCPTWLQTCVFELDGRPPAGAEREAYLKFIRRLRAEEVPLNGVLLYGLARPSMQPEATRLSALPQDWMLNFAAEIEKLGVTVKLSG